MAFHPLFRLGSGSPSGGVRSLLAFWIGGAHGTAYVPPTPEPEPTPAPSPGGVGRISGDGVREPRRVSIKRPFRRLSSLYEDTFAALPPEDRRAAIDEAAQLVAIDAKPNEPLNPALLSGEFLSALGGEVNRLFGADPVPAGAARDILRRMVEHRLIVEARRVEDEEAAAILLLLS